MIIRVFDCILSVIGLIFLIPLFIIISLLVELTSSGGIFFVQERVGKDGKIFKLMKFRSMIVGKTPSSPLTIGDDKRITPLGKFLRHYKLDELPQLFNVLRGEMSFVGPRPEVKEYVDMYTEDQRNILSVRPGMTDFASIHFFKEYELLAKSENPEETYIREIMPRKIEMNMIFVKKPTLRNYFKIILLTIKRILI